MAVGAMKDLPRVASNFGRLGVNLLMGLVLLPVLLGWLGDEWYGLYQLGIGSVGLAMLFDEVTRSSLIRELARAHHADDADDFKRVYNTGLALAVAAATLSAGAFAALYFIVPSMNIRPEMQGAARAMVLAEGAASFLGTLLSPISNMYLVTFRFIADNFWQVVRRSSYVVSALVCAYVLKIQDPAEGFTTFILLANGITIASLLLASAQIIAADRRLVPRPEWCSWTTLKVIWPTVVWNTLFNLAMNFYERTAGILMNMFFGLQGNAVWGVALQLASYVRMASLGVNSGIDSVSAKISVEHGEHGERMSALVRYGTVLHALVAIPVAVLIFGLAQPIVGLWVGRHLDPAQTQQAAVLTQILLIPVTVRSISDCWTRILYGAGFVARFAKVVLIGGIINPILSFALLKFAPFPPEVGLYVPALTFAGVYSFFHFFLLPIITVRCLRTRRREIFLPMLRPAIAGVIGLGFVMALDLAISNWTLPKLGVALVAYGVLTAVLAIGIALTPSQRGTLLNVVRRRSA